HGDSSMFIGGIKAPLLPSLHPPAMAAGAGRSGYPRGPWGGPQPTSSLPPPTPFGPGRGARGATPPGPANHPPVTRTPPPPAPDGRPYAASAPHLLPWVHIAEADSFLRAHTRFGARPLDQAGRDGYVADLARIGAALGVPNPPRTEAELAAAIARYRPELAG